MKKPIEPPIVACRNAQAREAFAARPRSCHNRHRWSRNVEDPEPAGSKWRTSRCDPRTELRQRMHEIVVTRVRYGYRRVQVMLR